MSFLPIVARELRVASRRGMTFLGRSVIALIATIIGGFLLLVTDVMNPAGGKGEMVFMVVAWYTGLIALVGGVFLASDCLSEERRDGTLGFLFLTDLKGYDVVLGKFSGVSLNAFYGMLAIFPVLAITLLAGGVTAGEFWRVCLALVNTLFFSVAVSMWVSALCKSSSRAMASSVCLLAGMLVLSAVAYGLASFGSALFYLSALSPLPAFLRAYASNYFHQAGAFWTSLAISYGMGWVFLGLASWRLADFREKGEKEAGWQRAVTRTVLGARTGRRSELLDVNPVSWLLEDSIRLRWIVWSLAIIGGAALLITAGLGSHFGLMFNSYLGWPFYFLLKVFFAIQACRFFSDARRTGSLELLCCTPVTMASVISGQWMALRRIFLWPVTVLILAQLACLCFLGDSIFSLAGSVATTVATKGAVATPVPPPAGIMGGYFSFLILKQIANSIADFFAVGWFGMWLAFSLQKPGTATGLTILYVLILPAVVFCIPTLATDAVFIVVGYSKLQQDFRRAGIAHQS